MPPQIPMRAPQPPCSSRSSRGRCRRCAAPWLLLLLLVAAAVAAAASCSPRTPEAFVSLGPLAATQRQEQQQRRGARLRMHGRKKRTGRTGGGAGSGSTSSSNNSGGGGGGVHDGGSGRGTNKTSPRPPRVVAGAAPAILSYPTPSPSSSVSVNNVASILGRSDKYGVLRTIEGLHERELQGPALVTAWDRLAQRTADAGPRAPHLPPLHLDRAFHLLVERTWRRLPELSPGHCASVASSLAKLRYRPEDAFLSDLLRSCQAQADAQSFGTAARLAASLARLDYDFGGGGGGGGGAGAKEEEEREGRSRGRKGELAALAASMRERLAASTDLEALHPESLAMGLWALAVLGALQPGDGDGDDLRERLLAASIARLRAAHAAAVVGGPDAPAPGDGGGKRRRKNVLAEGKAKNLVRICRQLRTALLFLPSPSSSSLASPLSAAAAIEEDGRRSESGGPSSSLMQGLSAQEELAAAIAEVWEDLGAWLDPVRRSRLQEEVESTLLAGGGRPAGEWGDGVVTVDIALHPRGEVAAAAEAAGARPVALEVDGPSHFFLNQPQRPTGDTKIKHQALHVGYPHQWAAVISVPHFEWPRIEKHRLDLLHRKLAQAGLEPAHFLAERKIKVPPPGQGKGGGGGGQGQGQGKGGNGGGSGGGGGGGAGIRN